MRAVLTQRDSISIEDEDAVIAERHFLGLPGAFIALVRVLPPEGRFIVIGRNPLFDGLPGWLDERNRGTATFYRQIAIRKALPLGRHVPNKLTAAVLAQSDKNQDLESFASAADL